MNEVYRISAVTLIIKNMERSCNFYSQMPGFKLAYGGSPIDSFTTYQIGKCNLPSYLNLELDVIVTTTNSSYNEHNRRHFGKIIFHTKDVDELFLACGRLFVVVHIFLSKIFRYKIWRYNNIVRF